MSISASSQTSQHSVTSIAQRDTARLSSRAADQSRLERAIVAYQARRSQSAYSEICAIYPPEKFMRPWFTKYRHLYDSREDFVQEYLMIFISALNAWKPRDVRPESRFAGSGNFANFFWSSLQNAFINKVKSAAAGRRSPSIRCPICDVWTNPLSAHLLHNHHELLWEQLAEFGVDRKSLTDCPFCKSFKMTRNAKVACTHGKNATVGTTAPAEVPVSAACADCKLSARREALDKHLVSMHSGFLFDRFRELYPEYVTISSRPASVNFTSDGDEGGDLYDFVSDERPSQKLQDLPLSPIQRLIVDRVFNGAAKVFYDETLYNCDPETFERELAGLRDSMTLVGMTA